MKSIRLLLASVFIFCGANAHEATFSSEVDYFQNTENEITATITKNTSDEQLTELVNYFKEHGITLNLSKVDYNQEGEITSIKINLSKNNQQQNFGLSSNTAISDIELGMRDGRLFVTSGANPMGAPDSLADLFNGFSGNRNAIDDFLKGQGFSFDFDFDSSELQDFFNNDFQHFDFNALRDQFLEDRDAENNTNMQAGGMPKFNFIDTPGVDKLIIINGKESNFKTLDKLAKADKLIEVDNLKPATAVSLYGNKAKDGAIIATTK